MIRVNCKKKIVKRIGLFLIYCNIKGTFWKKKMKKIFVLLFYEK